MVQVERLVKQLKEKNVDAFERLHDMYAENICGAINIIVRDEAIAQEICQDVFVKVWQRSHQYNSSKGRFFTWLLNMSKNAAIDHTRSKRFKNQKKNHSQDFFVDIYEKSSEDENSSSDYDGLNHLLKQLKKKCVELIESLYFKELTQKDTAEKLSIPLGTVKSRNRNCLQELRKKMER